MKRKLAQIERDYEARLQFYYSETKKWNEAYYKH